MELRPLSPQINQLRNVIISSNLISCYLILELLKSEKSETLRYEESKSHWIDIYKSAYEIISKMKPRKYRDKEFSETVRVLDQKAKR
jgi:predicted metal-dependent hydrolase